MSRYHDQLDAALAAVTIRGPTRYHWLGRTSRSLPTLVEASLDESERRSYLVACLREELYYSFYCHGAPVPARWGAPEPVSADPWLAAEISHANAGRGSWEPDWTVERLDGGEVVVTSPQLRMRAPIGDCRVFDGSIGPGAAVRVRLPKELPDLSPGFRVVVSEAPVDLKSWAGFVRVYWNITRAGAPGLVATLTSRLNGAGIPFRLKIADHAYRLERCDAAVLYLRGDMFGALRQTLHDVAVATTSHLRPPIPAFTLPFMPGVGLAEDVSGAESFGERRCALLADGILRTHEHGITNAEARIESVAARFAEDGVEINAPYLEPSLAGRHVL